MVELRKNQETILEVIREKEYALIVHFMRAGKTYPVCRYIKELNEKKDGGRTLIIAPPAVLPVWREHLQEIGCTNFWVVSSGGLSRRDWVLPHGVAEGEFSTLVIDEIHQYKAYTQRFQNIRTIAKLIPKRIGLSATPIENDLQDIFYIWQLLDLGKAFGTNHSVFQSVFCECINPRSDHPSFVFREKYVEETMNVLNKNMTVFRPKEIVAPEKKKILFKLSHEQTKWINNLSKRGAEKKAIPEVDGQNLFWSPGVTYSKFKQISSGFIYYDMKHRSEEGKVDKITAVYTIAEQDQGGKWDALSKLIRKLGKEQFIVWYLYNHEKFLIKGCATEEKAKVRFFEETSLAEFKSGKLQGLVCHPKSAGVGLDLSNCSHSIYTNLPDSGIDHLQSAYRTAKYGSNEKNISWYLVPDSPYFHRMWKRIEKKGKNLDSFYDAGNLSPGGEGERETESSRTVQVGQPAPSEDDLHRRPSVHSLSLHGSEGAPN